VPSKCTDPHRHTAKGHDGPHSCVRFTPGFPIQAAGSSAEFHNKRDLAIKATAASTMIGKQHVLSKIRNTFSHAAQYLRFPQGSPPGTPRAACEPVAEKIMEWHGYSEFSVACNGVLT